MKKSVLLALLALVSIGTMVGCRKKKDTIAIIYVRDSSNQPVSGAQVVLYGVSTLPNAPAVTLYDTTQTNSSGEAQFNFNEFHGWWVGCWVPNNDNFCAFNKFVTVRAHKYFNNRRILILT